MNEEAVLFEGCTIKIGAGSLWTWSLLLTYGYLKIVNPYSLAIIVCEADLYILMLLVSELVS